jgi:hypothetical protein
VTPLWPDGQRPGETNHLYELAVPLFLASGVAVASFLGEGAVDGRLSYQSSYGFASGQIPRRSQGTLLPSSGEPKVSNPWNNVQRKDSI